MALVGHVQQDRWDGGHMRRAHPFRARALRPRERGSRRSDRLSVSNLQEEGEMVVCHLCRVEVHKADTMRYAFIRAGAAECLNPA